MSRVWDPDVDEPVVVVQLKERFDFDALDDGRCKASSWRGGRGGKPTYENVFGPGGYNRCVGGAGHANRLHKDEWGNVFQLEPFRVVRKEEAS